VSDTSPEQSKAVAEILLQIKAIRLNPEQPFTWASGIKSPIYCDNRMVLSHPAQRTVVVESLVSLAKTFGIFDVVAGVATAGIPHGALMADRLSLPFVYVRDKPKGHGRQNRIEGHLEPGQRVLVVEDLISTGGSSLKAIEALREAGANIVGLVAIFSYGFEQAVQNFLQADCPFATLTNYNALIEVAIATGYIQNTHFDTLQAWRQAPQLWGVD